MNITFVHAAMALLLVFAAGTVVGATWVEHVLDDRSRRQAARQQDLNNRARYLDQQFKLLRERRR